MMTIGERIKKVRKEKNLTQQALATKLSTTQNAIARYETNRVTPSAAVISLICHTFHVREEWLREGIAPMFKEPTTNEAQVREWLNGILDEGSEFEQSFIIALSKFEPEDWEALKRLLEKLKAEKETTETEATVDQEAYAAGKTESGEILYLTADETYKIKADREAAAQANQVVTVGYC